MKHIVIMAGGSGTRFWPKSTQKNPKQFLKLFGSKSMIQLTYDRIKKLVPEKNISVVCAPQFAKQSKKHLPKAKLILEPEPRNTMAAVCLSAWTCFKQDPEAVICVLPADAYIANTVEFQNVLQNCFKFAQENESITCIGIKPTYAATGYGYIEVGKEWSNGVFKISRFVEKPDSDTALEYLNSGNYTWNAGIFVFKAKTFINEVKKHAPLYFNGFEKVKSAAQLKKLFKTLPKEPVDVALMEKTSLGSVVRGDFGWNDVGSWTALEEIIQSTEEAGIMMTPSKHISIESHGNIVNLESKKFLGLIGVKDLIIVETKEALLVCSKDKAQEIKNLVAGLPKK